MALNRKGQWTAHWKAAADDETALGARVWGGGCGGKGGESGGGRERLGVSAAGGVSWRNPVVRFR